MRVIVFQIDSYSNNLLFEDTFESKKHAEQWILNWAKKDKKYIILDLYVGRKNFN